ncbi:universal stress protein [Luteimonas sp. BDR2-5]|uniref:universal stress protein n=1 Tax=Proluteimonas luteida TaxID=2878685 RepID=UPI001E5C8A6E|nr:universal stress protein [Luteimonas sp. BDR2-5]MCD9029287.1 universal stress protein [Luteimonas sp. BDR2-5]
MSSRPDRAAPALPKTILLATDLSARCDRARDRAVLLARQWQARLLVLTVAPSERELTIVEELLEAPAWARRDGAARQAERWLQRDLESAGVPFEVQVTSGKVGPAIEAAAQAAGAGLIVTGVARAGAFQPLVLGSTIGWLARHASVPVLVVHDPAHAPYQDVAVASDFSPAAGQALETAATLFGDAASFVLVHGTAPGRAGMIDDAQARTDAATALRNQVQDEAAAQLDGLALPAQVRERLEVVVEPVEPARLLQALVDNDRADLVVLGSRGRSALSEILLGSQAQRVLESVRVDTLVVRTPPR